LLTGATYRDGGVAVSFTPPAVPTGATIRRYAYERMCSGSTTVYRGTTTGAANPVTITGYCPQGTMGSYRIAAQLDATTGAWSPTWITVFPPIGAPSISSVALTATGASVAVSPPVVPNGATIRRYAYERMCSGSTTVYRGTTTGATSPVTVSGSCPQGTVASYRLAAQLDATTGAWSFWT
jgi:hypothetical protein